MSDYPQYDRIAIVARAPSTRHLVKDIPDDRPVITLAACGNMPELVGKNVVAVVEIHPLWWIKDEYHRFDVWDFLMQERDFPVFMPTPDPAVPGAVEYPFEEIKARYGQGVLRGDDDRRNDYYTSSFDYMLPLALLFNPKRLDLIGWEMGTETEYKYQREGCAYWIGRAAALGVEIWLPEECGLLSSKLYGYDGTRAVTSDRLKELKTQAVRWRNEARRKHDRLMEQFQQANGDAQELIEKIGSARDDYFVKEGAMQAIDQLVEKFSLENMVPRQEIDLQKVRTQPTYISAQSRLNFWEGVTSDRQTRYESNKHDPENEAIFRKELEEGMQKTAAARDNYLVWQGCHQMLNYLLKETDMQYTVEGWEPAPVLMTKKVEEEEGA